MVMPQPPLRAEIFNRNGPPSATRRKRLQGASLKLFPDRTGVGVLRAMNDFPLHRSSLRQSTDTLTSCFAPPGKNPGYRT